jgi:hypothetical protein
MQNQSLRQQLVRLLSWEEAHVGFDRAVKGLPHDMRGARPAGFEHSAWQLVEHVRIAQEDIVDFCVNPAYEHRLAWPHDYWPSAPAPPSDAAWDDSIASVVRSRGALEQIAREVEDLTAVVPTGTGDQSYLRAVLLAADHVAYHVGQLIAVRRALGAWGE